MYGSSGKLGRGRGGGPVKRNIHSTFQPSSVQRPSATPAAARLSAGGAHRNRTNPPAAPATVATADETFSLLRNNPLNFGMIIRLSPVLVEEIKRLEAQGGAARIKFDSSSNNPAGNVIDVGGKEFRFTWSQETGDLCDIYEERRSGDNGDGLLVESGGAWRKLNVQRELDESFKNHVKMRTVEAELRQNQRKAIVLDHGNPSMKNQMKALAAAEVTNTWRGGSYKNKKEPPFKKMKAESSSAVVPPKTGGKAGLSSSAPSKVRASASPLLSTPEQSGAPLSPFRNSNITKVNVSREEAALTQSSKENATTFEKETFSRVPTGVIQNKPVISERFGNKPTDLQSLLISLLMEKPQGMNLKALEKAIGETIPKSVKQIEPVLKKIAVFQTPGRYILKPDLELESFKKSLSESGSSPENNNHNREPTAPEKADDGKEFEEQTHLISEPYEEINTSEKIDMEHRSPHVDILKIPENSSSVSGSGSDSDSSSSDSGSDSGSHSHSPVASGSGSSSDSESDASSNSKQGSDEDVDIMSDDDKELKEKPLQSDSLLLTRNIVEEKDDHHGSDIVALEKDLFEDNHHHEADTHITTNSFPDNYADERHETTNPFMDNHINHQETEVHARKLHSDTKSKTTSKRVSDNEKRIEENENAKRLKSGNWGRNSFTEDVSDYDYEKVNNREFVGNFTSDSPRSGVRSSIDLNARAKAPASIERTDTDVFFHPQKDKRDEENIRSKDKRPPKNSRADVSKRSGSHQKKNSVSGLVSSSSLIKDSPIDMKKSPIINGRGSTLRRELSDLEMGEFRENVNEEASGAKISFNRNNSLKQSENKTSSDYWNLDANKVNVSTKASPLPSIPPKKVVPEDHVDDFSRLNNNGKQLSRVDHAKTGLQHNKGRHNEAGGSLEGYTENQRKVSVSVSLPHKHEKQVVSLNTKDNRRQMSNDLGEKRKDFWDNGQRRREMESSSDDNSITSYMKYEKEEPEMKGPIRDLSQYNEYVQEYREKYDCYHTLNKMLESYRNEFQNFGKDLEVTKGRDNDRYNKIVQQLMESYRQCGAKHKRMKKIFIVLHQELQHLKEMITDFVDKQTKG